MQLHWDGILGLDLGSLYNALYISILYYNG
jgi:hypothetical protein